MLTVVKDSLIFACYASLFARNGAHSLLLFTEKCRAGMFSEGTPEKPFVLDTISEEHRLGEER